jgi:hypothetical protein
MHNDKEVLEEIINTHLVISFFKRFVYYKYIIYNPILT